MTGQVTSEIAEPDSTATYDLDTLSKHGAVKCIGGASAAGGGKDYHDKGKRGEGESKGAALEPPIHFTAPCLDSVSRSYVADESGSAISDVT